MYEPMRSYIGYSDDHFDTTINDHLDTSLITLARILVKMSSDCVTLSKRIKSKTTGPYIELLSCVPASPTDAVGMSCLLECALDAVVPTTWLLPC